MIPDRGISDGDAALIRLSLRARAMQTLLPKAIAVRLRAWRALARGHNPELRLLRQFDSGGTFVDIGANLGDYSRVACLIFARVVAIEPIPELAAILRRDLPGNASVLELALSDEPGSAILFVPIERDGAVTGLASLSAKANLASRYHEITVKVQTLDSLDLTGIDLLKIDVEGFEERVLRGGIETLRRERPGLIVEIEDRHHPGRTAEVFDLIRSLGYFGYYLRGGTLFGVPDAGERDYASLNEGADGTYINNFVFVHPSRSYPGLQSRVARK